MGKKIGLEVSLSAAEAVKMANVDCVGAYPITPQTHIVEHLFVSHAGLMDLQSPVLYSAALPGLITMAPISSSCQLRSVFVLANFILLYSMPTLPLQRPS